jgi:hypothetical protein
MTDQPDADAVLEALARCRDRLVARWAAEGLAAGRAEADAEPPPSPTSTGDADEAAARPALH